MTPEIEIQRALGRIEGKLDGIRDRLDRGDEETKGLDDRVTKLESRAAYYSGAAGVIGAMLSVAGKYLWDRIFA